MFCIRSTYRACVLIWVTADPIPQYLILPLAQDMVHTQQLYFWQHFRANRLKGNTAASEAMPNNSSGEMEAQSSGRILGSNGETQAS